MKAAINLSSLNISLDKFNNEASGVMNIGQIKLSSDGKSVYRTNNHETLTILNRTKISSEEALAVKFAFCKALSQEGLSQDAIKAVKQKLGIPGDAMAALKAGNIKPLTAAEVREVIDEYAGVINEKRLSAAQGANAPKTLKTSKEIYRGVGTDVMAARATTRNEINAKSISKLMTGADKSVNNLLDMLQRGETGKAITPDERDFAMEIMTKLSNPAAFNGEEGKKKLVVMTKAPVKFKLHDNGNVLAEFTLGNGNSFSVDTGLDRESLVDKAVAVVNAAVAANPPKVEKPRVEEKKSKVDDIMNAINELESGEIVDDDELEDVAPKKTETKKETGATDNVNLLNGLKRVFDALNEAKGQNAVKALRDANMNAVVNALLKALEKARPFDSKNTDIINNVREVFYGNKNIDSDYLFKTINDILSKKRADPRDKMDEDIKNNVLDLDETLNINALLGVDDETNGEAQVEGFGQNAKKVRDAHAQMAQKADEKTGTTTTERRNANILGMVNRSICDECKKMAAGNWENVTFFNDVSRQLNVTLPTGEKLSGEFEKARDQLAALVAKGARYADLDGAKKAKVHVLMAILNQRPGQGLLFSEGLTLDPKGNDSKIFFGGAEGKGGVEYSYMLSFAKDGSLDITCSARQKGFEMLMLFGGAKDGVGSVTVMPGKDSKVEATMELKIAPAELDRIAGMDFSKYDAHGVKAKYEDPNVQNRYSDRTLLGEDFMLDDANVTCTSTYKMTVN